VRILIIFFLIVAFLDARDTIKGKKSSAVLALTWHEAFCATHKKYTECQPKWFFWYPKNGFVLHGLWPQPKNNLYCGVSKKDIGRDKNRQWHLLPEPHISKDLMKNLSEVMPSVEANLHRHQWIKHGVCYGKDAEVYFRDSINLANEFRNSLVAKKFDSKRGELVTIKEVGDWMDEAFGYGARHRVNMICKNGFVSEIRLHLNSTSYGLHDGLRNTGKVIKSSCKKGRIQKGGFGWN